MARNRSRIISLTGRAAPPGAGGGPRRLRIDWFRLAIAVAVAYFVVTFIGQHMVLMDLYRQLNQLESQIETVKAQKAELQERVEYLRSEAYIRDQARSRFGLSRPGEIQYVPMDEDEAVDGEKP